MPILLSQEDLRRLLTMSQVIEAVEDGFRSHKSGRSLVPVRMPLKIKGEGDFLLMPACLEEAFGTKLISIFPRNQARGMATIQALYVLNDPTTGEFLAIMDGVLLTAIRTGAASAVATKYLAREDSSTLGIIGAGAQAFYQAEGICTVRPVCRILTYDTVADHAERFAKRTSDQLDIAVEVMESPRQVVTKADILATVTTSKEPVFDGRDLRPGTHINAVGAYTPEMREVDDETVEKARIVVDTYEGCMTEAGDLLIPIEAGCLSRESIHADLAQIVTGEKRGRTRDDEITMFESVGFALEDLVTAELAYRRAKETGVGFDFVMEG